MQVVNVNNIKKIKYINTLYLFSKPYQDNFGIKCSSDFRSYCIINMENTENIILNSELSFLKEDILKRKIISEHELLNGTWHY